MSALTVYTGLEAVLLQIDGLNAVILGEPTAVHDPPLLYVAYQEFDRPLRNSPPARNLVGMAHTFALRLVIQWVDNPEAERQLLTLLDEIPDAIDADPRLDSQLEKGIARVTTGLAGFATIGGTLYRIVDYTLEVLEKREAT